MARDSRRGNEDWGRNFRCERVPAGENKKGCGLTVLAVLAGVGGLLIPIGHGLGLY